MIPRPERAALLRPFVAKGQFHSRVGDRVRCEACPRFCTMKPGQRGFCYVREASGDDVVLTSYGRASGFCIDPIEKKPLSHFYPGTSVLSFGTAGCNLGCRFCQNWSISKATDDDRLADVATPEAIARAAVAHGCPSVAFTYNDPTIFVEYAVDTAWACRDAGVKSVAVTAGYIAPRAREVLFGSVDAANVDLKAFDEEFYRKTCLGHLAPVLETLEYVHRETSCWLEVTTLLIPGLNDSDDELSRLCAWFADRLGGEVPLHFTAFHPDYKLTSTSPTPRATLVRARDIAKRAGLRHVYTGNVVDYDGSQTHCTGCDEVVIARDRYTVLGYALDGHGACTRCGTVLAGRFSESAAPGHWGARRLPVLVRD